MRQTREEQKTELRPNRVPVYEANRNKLVVKGLDNENFYYRWVNDTNDRLAIFLSAGYEFVQKDGKTVGEADGVENSTGADSRFSKGVGGGLHAFLMRIPREIWESDQKRKEIELNAKLEADIKRSAKDNFTGSLDMGSGRRSDPFNQGGR